MINVEPKYINLCQLYVNYTITKNVANFLLRWISQFYKDSIYIYLNTLSPSWHTPQQSILDRNEFTENTEAESTGWLHLQAIIYSFVAEVESTECATKMRIFGKWIAYSNELRVCCTWRGKRKGRDSGMNLKWRTQNVHFIQVEHYSVPNKCIIYKQEFEDIVYSRTILRPRNINRED